MKKKLLSLIRSHKFLFPALAITLTGLTAFSFFSTQVFSATAPVANAWNLVKDAANNLQFQYSTSGVSRMTITSDGKVGIGTAPAATFQLNGFSQFSNGHGNSHIPYSNGNIYLSAPNILFRNGNNSDTGIINNVGYFGIGTTSPGFKLDVQGGGIRSAGHLSTNNLGEVSPGWGGVNTNHVHTTLNDNWLPYPANNWNYIRGNTMAFKGSWHDEDNSGYYIDPNNVSNFNRLDIHNGSGNSHIPYSDGNIYLSGHNIIFRNNGNAEVARINSGGLSITAQNSWPAALTVNNNMNISGQWSWSAPVRMVEFFAFGQWVGEVYSTNNGTIYGNASDYRLKENITSIDNQTALERILQVPVREYVYKNRTGEKSVGFVAHELQPFVPEAVAGEKDGVDKDGKPVYQAVDYGKLTPMLTASIQELNKKIEKLETDNTELKKQNELLKILICKDHPQEELCR